ncbi:MAG: LytTR family DNA-binding domain-containing protein, partial [Atopobiaceae bacterium]|nr:LytTR family DNA-binding domain-containing protein [Atopobiaceae bacterium]
MLRVAIVDDEAEVRGELAGMVERFADERGEQIVAACYADGKEFLASGATEDIVLLDIEMDDVNGMDMAHLLRRKGVTSEIIFVTNMAQYAIKGYEVGAIDFIVKPVRYTSFAFKFRRAVEAAKRKGNSRIAVETREGVRYISSADLVYVEVRGHKLIYHGEKGSFEA